MKSAIWLLGFLTTMELAAQNPSAPAATLAPAPNPTPGALAPAPNPTPGAITPPPAQTTSPANAAVGAPALATSLNSAALTNGLAGFAFTNQFGTNFTSGNLASVLFNLQVNLQQTLALLGNFNGSLSEFGTTAATRAGVANLAQNLASGGGVNLSQNLAQNVAVPTAPASPPATPPSVFAPPGQSPVPPTALAAPLASPTDIAGMPLTPAGSNTFGGTLAFNDSVRLLIILQNDIERLLSQVALATGTPVNLPAGSGMFATNNFGVGAGQLSEVNSGATTGTPRIPARTSTPRTLTPTGR